MVMAAAIVARIRNVIAVLHSEYELYSIAFGHFLTVLPFKLISAQRLATRNIP